MSVKAIIHDWDDTIVASFSTYLHFFNYLADLSNLPRPSSALFKSHWGKPTPAILSSIWPNITPSRLQSIVSQIPRLLDQNSSKYTPKLLPGAKQTLIKFQRQGLTLGLITSSPRFYLEKYYRLLLGPNIHYFRICHEDTKYPKPDPRVFQKPLSLLRQIGISQNEVVYVGDNLIDWQAAQDRGITFYAVTTGVNTKSQFLKSGLSQNHILSSFSHIISHL